MNEIVKAPQPNALAISEEEAIRVLGNSLYPGAKPESIKLVLAWCRANGRDPMKRPIHIVPMWVKDAVTGKGEMRDVLMPGIGTYRSDAAESGAYAGKSEPEFGPDVTGTVGTVRMTYPRWCKVTVERMVQGQVRKFTAMEFWLENYANAGFDKAAQQEKEEPNYIWRKRPYGMLAKCAESQALRMAFPDETGNTNTAEEMEGKAFAGMTIDAEPRPRASAATAMPLNDEIPERVMERGASFGGSHMGVVGVNTRPRTRRDVLNDLHATLLACHTTEEIEAIAQSDDVAKATATWGEGTAFRELNALIVEALDRVKVVTDDTELGGSGQGQGA